MRCCSDKMGTVTRMFIRVIFDWHLYVYVCHPFQTVDYCGFMRTSVEDFVPQKPWLFFRWSMPLQSTNCRLLDHRISHTSILISFRQRKTVFNNTSGLPCPWQSLKPQAVCNMLRSKTAFGQDEHNVESFSFASAGQVQLNC